MSHTPKYPVNFNDYCSILCLDGDLPPADFFQTKLPIIAADGAANKLMKMGIEPMMVIGDLDSIEPHYREQLKTHHHYDQNFCDFEKSLSYLEAHDLLPSVIVGVNGGSLDHILNNINIFMRSNNFLYAPPLSGHVLRAGQQKSFLLPLHSKISMMGIPSALVSSVGLKWEMKEMTLSFPGKNSCFNQSAQAEVDLQVHEGSALVLIYH